MKKEIENEMEDELRSEYNFTQMKGGIKGKYAERYRAGTEQGEMSGEAIKDYKDLEIYQMAFDAAMNIFQLSKKFPVEERYSLTDQIRRSRSICANLAEAWRKRRDEVAFVVKLNDCEAEAAETQTWIEFAVKCNYIDVEAGRELYGTYNRVLSGLVNMINNTSPWLVKH